MILLLQFWGNNETGDKNQAMSLARLIADIEPTYRADVTVMFCARWDTSQDEQTIDYVSKKFRVERFTTNNKVAGWPMGCNKLMGESYMHAVEYCRKNHLKDEFVMLIEADCVPLRTTWINEIKEEYLAGGKMVLGAYMKQGDGGLEHVNGNLVMSINFWRKCPDIFNPPSKHAWDNVFKGVIMANCTPSKLIWSDWRIGLGNNPWRGCGSLWEKKQYRDPSNPLYSQELTPCWFHGVKTLESIECVRRVLIDGDKESQNVEQPVESKQDTSGY